MKDFKNKKFLTEEPCLAHYARDRQNFVKTDASKIVLGITLWQKQSDGKNEASGKRYLSKSEKKLKRENWSY